MTSLEHYHVIAEVKNKGTGITEKRVYGNKGTGIPGYTKTQADHVAEHIRAEFAGKTETDQNFPLELVSVSVQIIGALATVNA